MTVKNLIGGIALLESLPSSFPGRGPFHSTNPNLSLRDSWEDVLARYPAISANEEYLRFLQTSAGFSIYCDDSWPPTPGDHRLEIYGFDPNANCALLDEDDLWDDEYFVFSLCIYVPKEVDEAQLLVWPFNSYPAHFALRLRDKDDPVVYVRVPNVDEKKSTVFMPFAGSLTDCLYKFYDCGGRCPDERLWAHLVEVEREKRATMERRERQAR